MNYPFSGYVTCNGAYVEYHGEPVYKAIIPSEAIKATMALSEQYDFNYYFESSDYIYVRDQNDERHQWFAKNWGMKPETVIDDFDPETIETYIGMIVVNDKKDISPMVNALSKYFDVQRHQSDYSFDLTLKGVSKAVGIEKLVERINRNIDDTIAFGDGRNDIEMLETVKIVVAMGNAVDQAKAVANYETDRIYCDISRDDVCKLLTWLEAERPGYFREYVRKTLEPYDGFIPFYSNNLTDWRDFDTWDNVQLSQVLEAVSSALTSDCDNWYDTVEGDYWDWAAGNYSISDYMTRREKEEA